MKAGYEIFFYVLISSLVLISSPYGAWAQSDKVLKTKYATVYYDQDQELNDFVWRLSGQRMSFPEDYSLASNRIDRLVNRVQAILDMWPEDLQITMRLYGGKLQYDKIAYYDEKTKEIHICVEYTSDGVVAHEIAHAVMKRYFGTAPPSKVSEILAQYVDKNLWSDY